MPRSADYCPISEAVDILGDRWTPLVVRELMIGCTGFNEIHRGVPRMSRTLLSQRLRMLERRGLLEREAGEGRSVRYVLTPPGRALSDVVWSMGQWAAEWAFGDPTDEQLDGVSLLWRMSQRAIPDRLPAARTVVHLVLTGTGGTQGWLAADAGSMAVCKSDPGYDVDLAVEADTRQMHRWLLGVAPFSALLAGGHARLLGPSKLARAFPGWFDTTYFTAGLRRAERRRGVEEALAG